MKRIAWILLASLVLIASGCGGSGEVYPPSFTTQILSEAGYDGDIAKAAGTGTLTITQGNTQSVFTGFDPVDGSEYRAFLNFPLTGSGGVPGNAVIIYATLDLFINGITPNPLTGTIPVRIDLVDFAPFTLVGSDFDRTSQPALASTTITPPISQSDFAQHVPVDVTSLMREAQNRGLSNFQLRILRDPFTVAPGLIEINDTTGPNRGTLAPLLEVSYY